jgi:hypothetical protein
MARATAGAESEAAARRDVKEFVLKYEREMEERQFAQCTHACLLSLCVPFAEADTGRVATAAEAALAEDGPTGRGGGRRRQRGTVLSFGGGRGGSFGYLSLSRCLSFGCKDG